MRTIGGLPSKHVKAQFQLKGKDGQGDKIIQRWVSAKADTLNFFVDKKC